MTGPPELALARSAVDRAAHRRTDDLLTTLLGSSATRVLAVADGRTPVRSEPLEGDPGQLHLDLRPPTADDFDRVGVFLGTDVEGVDHVAVALDDPAQEGWRGLREVGAVLDARDAGLLTQAVALLSWHATHTHCARCGSPTRVVEGGYSRRCDADGTDHYPRTDPAVIMTVIDTDDRLLLGHQVTWPAGRYSTLAGFVEPGESLEAAVRREAFEETGITVGRVEYFASQPWPFPASIMLAFHGYATSRDITVDGVEIERARWFTRQELADAVAADPNSAGAVRLPPRVSIARALIEDWYGGPLDDDGGVWR